MRNFNQQSETIDLWPDAAQLLGIGRNAVYQAAQSGEIVGLVRIGHRYLVRKAPFLRWLRGEGPGLHAVTVGKPEAQR